jgi:hypothetical protein
MLARYGIRGILLEPTKPWRAIAFIATVFIGMYGGFRSVVILYAMIFATLFFLERLHQTRMLPVMIIVALVGGTLMAAFANRLPFAVQRSIAFLPIDINPEAREAALTTSQWRWKMWQDLLPEVPQYLILGKGYGFSARDMAMLQDFQQNRAVEGTVMAGDYHNGPLSVIIPFGIAGLVGFLWFLWAGLRVIYQNYKFGNPAYHRANAYLLAFFAVKIIIFFTIFGGLASDLTMFAGLVGLSVSLNGGVAKPAVVPEPKVVFSRFKLHPSVRRPLGV